MTRDGERKPEVEPREETPFLPILRYVLGFLLILGLLAFAIVWLLRR